MEINVSDTEKTEIPGTPKLTKENWRKLRRLRDTPKPEPEKTWKELYQEVITDHDEKLARLRVQKATLEMQAEDVRARLNETTASMDAAVQRARELDRVIRDPNRLISAGFVDEVAADYVAADDKVKFLSGARETLSRELTRLERDGLAMIPRIEYYESDMWIISAVEHYRQLNQNSGTDLAASRKYSAVTAKLGEMLPHSEPVVRQPVDSMESWRRCNIIKKEVHDGLFNLPR